MKRVVKAKSYQASILTSFPGNLILVMRGSDSSRNIINGKQNLGPYDAATNMGLCMRAWWRLQKSCGISDTKEIIPTRSDQQRLAVGEDIHMSLKRSPGAEHILSSSESMYSVRAV